MLTIEMPQPTKAYILLTDLSEQGKLEDHVKEGLISARMQKRLVIYNEYKKETSRFKTKSRKVCDVMARLSVCRAEVYFAIRMMEG